MKISRHRRCPKCGKRKITKRYPKYHCEHCLIYFKGLTIGSPPLVIRIAFKPR